MDSRYSKRIPKAIPILIEERGKLKLCEDGLQEIFMNPQLHGKHISMISISGGFRKGKSFMLNFFLRYLRNKGHANLNWMGDENAECNDGFKWKGGRHACTSGIVIWNEVFFARMDGKEVGILLMDTQGLFDGNMDRANNSMVFALSTLISSVQIYNVSQQLQDSDLDYLQFFTDYARAAQNCHFDADAKQFQTLTFLIRDWPHAEQLSYGMAGGDIYLQEVLRDDSRSEEIRAIKRHLSESFERINCCLLPYPGKKVAETQKPGFCLCLKDMKGKFRDQTAKFVDQILNPENLVVKCLNGQPIGQYAIMKFISDCVENMTNGNLPTPRNMMENVATAQNLGAQRQCEDIYSAKWKELMGDIYMADDALLGIHHEASTEAYDSFRNKTRLGGEESRQKYLRYLEDSIKKQFELNKEIIRATKIAAESKLLQLVERLVNEYEDMFSDNAVEGQEYLKEEELESWHVASSFDVLKKFDADDLRHHSVAGDFRTQLQNRVERSYQKFKSDNTDKRKIAEEVDHNEQLVLRERMKIVLNFRNHISQRAEEYMDEYKLRELCETERRNAVDMFEIQLIIDGVTSTFRMKEAEQLDERLRREIKTFNEINEEKKTNLRKRIESQIENTPLQYELYFQAILKNGYMEKEDLLAQHNEIVGKLMDDQRDEFNSRQLSQQPVKDHLRKTNEMLDRKYNDIKTRNDKNFTVGGRIFRVAKKHGLMITSAAVRIAETVKDILGLAKKEKERKVDIDI